MKRVILTFLLILSAAHAPWSAELRAQDPSATDVISIRQTLDHLKQQLEFLVGINRKFPNDQLGRLILMIEEHLIKAERAMANRQGDILKLEIAAASQLIKSAMQTVLRGPVSNLREQLEEKLRRIEQLLSRGFRQDAQRLLQSAQRNKDEAEIAFKSGNQNKGLQLLQIAIFDANKALELLSSAAGNDLQRAYLEEKTNFDQLAQQVLNPTTADARATDLQSQAGSVCQGLYQDALEQRKKAESAYARGELRIAVDTYRWATRLLLRAIDLCEPARTSSSDAQTLEQLARSELTRTQQLLDNVASSVDAGTDNPVSQMIRRARTVLADAHRSFDSGQYRDAIAKANLVKMILNRIRRSAAAGVNRDSSLDPDIQMLQDLLAELVASLDSQDRPMARGLYDLARQYFDLAVRANQMGRPTLAAARLFAATKFALLVKGILSGTAATGDLTGQAAEISAQFDQRYQTISARVSGNADPMITAWYNLASDIFRSWQAAKASQHSALMLYHARIGLEVLQRLERRLNRMGN